jgi:hypothetical protein
MVHRGRWVEPRSSAKEEATYSCSHGAVSPCFVPTAPTQRGGYRATWLRLQFAIPRIGQNPIQRYRFAALGRAMQLGYSGGSLNRIDLMTGNQMSAAETEPSIIERLPFTPSINLPQQIELILSRELQLHRCDNAQIITDRHDPDQSA